MNIDFFLDITSEICPLTFVKTKLLIEKMQPGQVAELRLQGFEPLQNIPRSLRENGHAVLCMEALDKELGQQSPYRLLFRKGIG